MRCAIYCRVSSDEQKEGRTIESQIKELEDFAPLNNHTIVAKYLDDGWSGALLERPELDRLRDDASKGLFEAVLINDVDRLSRELTHLGVIKKDLEKKGIKLIFKKLPTDDSPTSNFMVNILGSFAEFERQLIADRTRRGKRYKVETRKIILGNVPPYGYDYVKKSKEKGIEGYYTLNPKEAKVVRLIFNWAAKESTSQREIIKRLSKLKIAPRKGIKWGRSTICRILTNETYIGITYFNKHQSVETDKHNGQKYYRHRKTGLRLRPKSEWIPIPLPKHLKIVDEKIFWAVQVRLKKNKIYASRNSKYFYLLKGLVKCGNCKSAYYGTPCHEKLFYRCSNRYKTFPLPRECRVSMIKSDKLDSLVWKSLSNALQNPTIIIDQVNKLINKKLQQPSKIEENIKETTKELDNLKKEEGRLFEAYKKGVIQLGRFQDELDKINIGRNTLEIELTKSEKDRDINPSAIQKNIKSIQEYCQLIKNKLNMLSLEQRQFIVRSLIEKIIIHDKKVRILGIIPAYSPTKEKDTQIGNLGLISNTMPTISFYKGRLVLEKHYWLKLCLQFCHL